MVIFHLIQLLIQACPLKFQPGTDLPMLWLDCSTAGQIRDVCSSLYLGRVVRRWKWGRFVVFSRVDCRIHSTGS